MQQPYTLVYNGIYCGLWCYLCNLEHSSSCCIDRVHVKCLWITNCVCEAVVWTVIFISSRDSNHWSTQWHVLLDFHCIRGLGKARWVVILICHCDVDGLVSCNIPGKWSVVSLCQVTLLCITKRSSHIMCHIGVGDEFVNIFTCIMNWGYFPNCKWVFGWLPTIY